MGLDLLKQMYRRIYYWGKGGRGEGGEGRLSKEEGRASRIFFHSCSNAPMPLNGAEPQSQPRAPDSSAALIVASRVKQDLNMESPRGDSL